jgi:hypothetical protein
MKLFEAITRLICIQEARTPIVPTDVFHSLLKSLQRYLKLNREHFLPHLFQFIIHCHRVFRRCRINKSVVKETANK